MGCRRSQTRKDEGLSDMKRMHNLHFPSMNIKGRSYSLVMSYKQSKNTLERGVGLSIYILRNVQLSCTHRRFMLKKKSTTMIYLDSHLASASPPAFLRCHLKMHVAVCPRQRAECVSSSSSKQERLENSPKKICALIG